MTAEQDKARREEIARQREERLKLRLQKRETEVMNEQIAGIMMNDENSQASLTSGSGQQQQQNKQNPGDFNFKNFFLMNKVLNKILQSKYAWPFKDAVSEDDAPDYNEIIEVIFRYSFRILNFRK